MKFLAKSFSLGLLTQILLTQIVYAGVPVKYPTCAQNIKLKEVSNGAGVYFDETCSVAYVLPPATGQVKLDQVAPNMNLKLCPSYESSLKNLNNLYDKLTQLNERMNSSSSGGDHSNDIDTNTSIDGNGSSSPNDTIPTIDPAIFEEQAKIFKLIDSAKQTMAYFEDNKKGVAVASIKYTLDWGKLLEQYRAANPKIHFEKLPLEAGRIVFSRKVNSSDEVVTGTITQDIYGIENTSDITASGTLGAKAGSVIMGDAISGQVVLNFAGACPFVKNGQMPSTIEGNSLSAYIAANFQYKFSLQSLRKYKAAYNLASIAKHISEVKSKGGLFSSKTVNSITDSNWSRDEFNFVMDSDQSSYEFESSLRAEVKTELIGRVLSEMALSTGQPVVMPQLSAPPVHGSTVLADGLQKCPNLYCQIGSIGLRIVDSIFGNSTAVAEYIRTKDGVAVDNVTEKKMFSYLGSSTFSGK